MVPPNPNEFDSATRVPRWVAEHLTAASLARDGDGADSRSGAVFREDPSLPPALPKPLSSAPSLSMGAPGARGRLRADADAADAPILSADLPAGRAALPLRWWTLRKVLSLRTCSFAP